MTHKEIYEQHSWKHREELEASELMGCMYCLGISKYAEIKEWCDGGKTALCPKCGVDAVLGDASGHPVTDKEFLTKMNILFFSRRR